MSNHFLFSVHLETSAPVEQENMRRSVQKVIDTYSPFAQNVTVYSVPLPADVEGITAHALVEIVRLKEQVSNLQIALHGALDLLKAPGNILQAQANGGVEKVAHWIAEQTRK